MSEEISVEASFKSGESVTVRGVMVGRYLAGEVVEPTLVYGTRGPGAGTASFDRFYIVHLPSAAIVCTHQYDFELTMRVVDALSAHGPDLESTDRHVVMDAIMATRIPEWANSESPLPYHHWLRERQ